MRVGCCFLICLIPLPFPTVFSFYRMKRTLQKWLLWVATLLASGASAVALSTAVSPLRWQWLGVLPLSYPLAVAGALFSLVATLFFYRKKIWLPLFIGLPAYWAVPTYIPFHPFATAEKEDLKVMSYNVRYFDWDRIWEKGQSDIATYIASQQPDLVFLQEASLPVHCWEEVLLPAVRPHLRYYRTMRMGESSLVLLSKYPIVAAKRISMPGESNGAAYFKVEREEGDTLIAVNCHLESLRLSTEEREGYSHLAGSTNHEWETYEKTPLHIAQKIAAAGQTRALQVQAVRNFLVRHKGKKVILAGDFNDTPISYAHAQMRKELTDCYAAAGTGIGRSFNKYRMVVRIDHLFCSPHYTPTTAVVDDTAKHSDHYPLLITLKEKR